MAGSSARILRTTSTCQNEDRVRTWSLVHTRQSLTFCDDSHRGIDASLWRHLSGEHCMSERLSVPCVDIRRTVPGDPARAVDEDVSSNTGEDSDAGS